MKKLLKKDEEEEEKGSFYNIAGLFELRPDSPDARPLDQPASDAAYDPDDQANGAEEPPIPLYQPVGRHRARLTQSSGSIATSTQIEPPLSSSPQAQSLPSLPIKPPQSSSLMIDSPLSAPHQVQRTESLDSGASSQQVHSLPKLEIEPPQSSSSSSALSSNVFESPLSSSDSSAPPPQQENSLPITQFELQSSGSSASSSPPQVQRTQSLDSSATSSQQVHSLPELPIEPPQSSSSSCSGAPSSSQQVHSLPVLPIEPPQSSSSSSCSGAPSSSQQVRSLPARPTEPPQSSSHQVERTQSLDSGASSQQVHILPKLPMKPPLSSSSSCSSALSSNVFESSSDSSATPSQQDNSLPIRLFVLQSSGSSTSSSHPQVQRAQSLDSSAASSQQVHSLPELPIEPPQSSSGRSASSSFVIDSLLLSPRHGVLPAMSAPETSPASSRFQLLRAWFSTSCLYSSDRPYAGQSNSSITSIQIRYNPLGQPLPVHCNAQGVPIDMHTAPQRRPGIYTTPPGVRLRPTAPELPLQSTAPEVSVQSTAPEVPVQTASEVPVQSRELEVAIPIDDRSPQDILREIRDRNFVTPTPFTIAAGLYEGTFFLAPAFPVRRRPPIQTSSPHTEVIEFNNGLSDEDYDFGDEGPSVRGWLQIRRDRYLEEMNRTVFPYWRCIPIFGFVIIVMIGVDRLFSRFEPARDRTKDDPNL
ncbi:cell wall protein RBR3-like isoform X2 [Bradysia coprophila]|uniref:cell wall protein RBR3-like isoform X2 n=1 Tax=Bradysia coprophila TaxID=38358 RepID=UPI00187D7796|nr:cell wall protein RBR3-like isoform X2 [Bradysia coprophila]